MSPKEIVQKMISNDPFSKWLGIEIYSVIKGSVSIKIKVVDEMLNGFSMAHGGITYSLSDSALAFSANTYGQHAVSIETSISHIAPVFKNDVLVTKVQEVSKNNKIGIYNIDTLNQHNVVVSNFRGTVYFKKNKWE